MMMMIELVAKIGLWGKITPNKQSACGTYLQNTANVVYQYYHA